MPGLQGYGANAFLDGFTRAYEFVDNMQRKDEEDRRQKRIDAENADYRNRVLAIQEAGTESEPFEAVDQKTGLRGLYTRNSKTGAVSALTGLTAPEKEQTWSASNLQDASGNPLLVGNRGDLRPIAGGKVAPKQGQENSYFVPVQTPGGYYGFNSRTGTAAPLTGSDGKQLVPAAIDPATQGAVAEAKSTGTMRGKYAGSQSKVLASLNDASAKTDQVIGAIDKALGMVNGWTTGASGTVLSQIPGTNAKDLQRTLDAVRANIGFGELQQMRVNSPTGGALGAVSERENTLLQSVLGSLEQDQSPQQLRENLMKARSAIVDSRNRLRQAYEADFGGVAQPTSSGQASAPSAQAAPNLEGRTATNPKTGQTIIFRNGKWESAQ